MVSPCFEELQQLTQSGNVNCQNFTLLNMMTLSFTTFQNNESAKIRTTFRLNMIATLFQSLNINIDEPPRDDTQTEKLIQPVLYVMQNMMHIFTIIGRLWTKEPTVIEVSLETGQD